MLLFLHKISKVIDSDILILIESFLSIIQKTFCVILSITIEDEIVKEKGG